MKIEQWVKIDLYTVQFTWVGTVVQQLQTKLLGFLISSHLLKTFFIDYSENTVVLLLLTCMIIVLSSPNYMIDKHIVQY